MMKKLMLLLILFPLISSAKTVPIKEEVRGVWVPDPQYTDVLKSYQNVVNFVSLLDSLNFNSVFIVSYALNKTIYPSSVLLKNTTYSNIEQTNMLTPFLQNYNSPSKSPTGDPVADLLNEAHKRKIKVFFWYEFGFMADIKPVNADNNPILAINPSWLGVGNDGKPSVLNIEEYYFNAFDPAVQNYLLDLILEAVRRYPTLDGIQGDDRLPAMYVNSGYDPLTIARYKKEHNNQSPPLDYKNEDWVKWRLDILNDFGKKLYTKVKATNPKVMVSFAPNPYPWCKDVLLQDWPTWVNDGICDLLAVQCYRDDSTVYVNTLKQTISHIKPAKGKTQLFVPGVVLMLSGKLKNLKVIRQQLQTNRILNTKGEIFFYNEALNFPVIKQLIKEFYIKKAPFPTNHNRK